MAAVNQSAQPPEGHFELEATSQMRALVIPARTHPPPAW